MIIMPESAKSSVKQANPKPNNVFYIWYTELCRRLNSNPTVITAPAKAKSNTILDFAADRLKFEDWNPLINALRLDTSLHVICIRSRTGNYQFLHDVDTEDKTRRLKRKFGSLWTDYILNSLVRALSCCLKSTHVLTCLELDGLPVFGEYLENLLRALKENKSVKSFSLANCSVQDPGCRAVCLCLQLMPNIETLNLSRCDLTSTSGIYLAKLIKFQQLNRYTTSWHKSLRYSEPDAEKMCGIKRITLNCNPKLGDQGLNHILDELEDDLWLKALDMQKCGITENIGPKLVDVISYNQSLLVADFRQNEQLNPITVQRILDILSSRCVYEYENEKFQWYASIVSLNPSISTLKDTTTNTTTTTTNKTFTLPKTPKPSSREEFLKKNEVKQPNGYRKRFNRNVDRPVTPHTLNGVVKTFSKLHHLPKPLKNTCPSSTPVMHQCEKPKNGFKNNAKQVNLGNSASNIFAMLMSSEGDGKGAESSDDEETKSLMSYYRDCYDLPEICDNRNGKLLRKKDCSDSQISLYEYMEELEQAGTKNMKNGIHPASSKSKQYYKRKINGIK